MEAVAVKHLSTCVQDRAAYEAALAEYARRWPNYCRACGGTGGIPYEENVGERDYPVYDRGVDPCAACAEKGVCPRCGQRVWDGETEDEWICSKCGCKLDEPQGAPSEPVCLCDLAEEGQAEWEAEQATFDREDTDERALAFLEGDET